MIQCVQHQYLIILVNRQTVQQSSLFNSQDSQVSIYRESFFGERTQTNPIVMDPVRPEVVPTQDLNSNVDDAIRENEKKGLDQSGLEPEVVSIPTTEYADMKGDPSMRQVFANGRPAAGYPSPPVPYDVETTPSSRRHYKMASDIFGTGLDSSWSDSPKPAPIEPTQNTANPNLSPSHVTPNFDYPVNKNAPRSFKITEMALNSSEIDEPAGAPTAGRRARESNGNPVTGQGFDQSAAKTGKRYFEGSNANSKLW